MGNWVRWLQGLLVVVALGLAVALIVSSMPGQPQPSGSSQPAAESSPAAEPSTQPAPALGNDTPGVPDIPIDQHEVWPTEEGAGVDRQLDVTATSPSVELPAALGDDLSAYWQQTLTWEPCAGGECATMKVPLDWENPGKAALDISVIRIKGTDSTLGPLFVNPGGPGVGAKDFAISTAKQGWAGYDIVGWDPRGSGDSTHVECGTTEQTDAAYLADGTPDDEAERSALIDAWTAFGQQCRQASGELLDHLSTIENVRDLDLLRFLLGAEKLNYIGVSYGTYIGALYAELFPENTGRMVLDSAVNITDDDSVSQADGFELALTNYATWCAGDESCTLGSSTEEIMTTIDTFLRGLDAQPLQVGDRTLSQGYGANGIALFLYSGAEMYPVLTLALVSGMAGDGGLLLEAADQVVGRVNGQWDTQAFAFPAIRCVDSWDLGVDEAFTGWEESVPKSPVFAGNTGVDLVCERWTAAIAPQLKPTGKGAAPILVVGSTGDSATPYEHAVTMAQQLESGVLLTYDGPGHGAISANNSCVDETLHAYLEKGTLPEDQKTCS